jgi:hypothetical protein
MGRTYARDSRGRFASKGTGNLTTTLRGAASGRAPKRLEFLRTYHGTGTEAARAIKAGGYRESWGGASGPGVYTSKRKSVAQGYAQAMDVIGGKGLVIAHRVPKASVVTVSSDAGQRAARAAGRPFFDEDSTNLRTVLLNKATADRTMIRSTGTVRRPRRRRR